MTEAAMTDVDRHLLVRQRMQETSKLDPKVPLHLNGTDYRLHYTNRAVKGILEDTTLNILDQPLGSEKLSDPAILGSVLFRGLQKEHPDLTLEAVDDLISVRHLLYIQTQITVALSLFYPDVADLPLLDDTRPEAGDEDPTQRPAASGSATGGLVGVSASAT